MFRLILPSILALAATIVSAAEPAVPEACKDYLCCWQYEQDKEVMILLEPARCVLSSHENITVCPAHYEPGKIVFGAAPNLNTSEVELKDGKLLLKNKQGVFSYTRLQQVPEELQLKPMAFGAAAPPPAKIKEIQSELATRHKEDQAVRTDPKRRAEMGKVDAGNTAWLIEAVKQYGWIDVGRFGDAASNVAFLIVQHSGKVSLMQAALPEIEKDLKAGKLSDGQNFALLYDRLKLRLGEKQRYGSQVGSDEQGNPVVLPLENPAKVDEFRKQMKMCPLAQYLAFFEQRCGKKIKIPTE